MKEERMKSDEKANKNIVRLINWMTNILATGFTELELKEQRIFENTQLLTSSADFIKAVRNSDMQEV